MRDQDGKYQWKRETYKDQFVTGTVHVPPGYLMITRTRILLILDYSSFIRYIKTVTT